MAQSTAFEQVDKLQSSRVRIKVVSYEIFAHNKAIWNDSRACPDARVGRCHPNLIEHALELGRARPNQAARSTTSVISSCCGAPSANAWAAAWIRLIACRAGRP